MTLKEKLDGKLPPLSSVIWEELEGLFLELGSDVLAKGVSISVYQNNPRAHFCHYVENSSKSRMGISFTQDFDVDTLKEVISIAEKNGIVVETVTENSYYKFIYVPTWK